MSQLPRSCRGSEPPVSGVRLLLVALLCVGPFLPACSPALESMAEDGVAKDPDPASEEAAQADDLRPHLSLPAPDSVTERRALERLEEALEEWRTGERVRNAHRADTALALIPTAEEWRPLVLAELLAAAGDTAGVRGSLSRLDRGGELWMRWGWAAAVEAYEEADDPEAALRAARTSAEILPADRTAGDAWLRAGRLALEVGDTASAREDLLHAVRGGPNRLSARSAARTLDQLPGSLAPADEVRVGRALLAAGSWAGAHRRLIAHLDGPEVPSSQADELRQGVGRALFELRRFGEAQSTLAPLLSDSSPPDVAAPALYWTGRAALARGDVAGAEHAFREIARRSPDSDLAEQGLHRLLERELETGFGPRARGYLEELLQVGVRSGSTELTLVRLATEEYLTGNHSGAADIFERYLLESRRNAGRQQAGYWSALSHERLGEYELARTRLGEVHASDPLTFYGVFAGERIDAGVLPQGLVEGPDPRPELEVELRNALIRLRIHRLVPTSGSFAFELERLTRHFADDREGAYDFAEALIEGGFPLQGIVLGRDIHREEGAWNYRLLRIVHPFPHREAIVRESRTRGLDPFFVAGLIRQESMFDARIRSPAGAVGLMQLMPATAREVAASLGLRYSPEALDDPEINVRLGTTFLARMVSRFDGLPEDALAAYNAGPGRIQQWRQRPVYRDRDVFMEHIPFQETRHYVKVVQQYARIYTALYGCGSFEPCPGLSYPAAVAQSPHAGGAPLSSVAR